MASVSAITILQFLLSPEDSSASAPKSRYTGVSSFWKVIKAALWITLSVIAAIFAGRL